jgi:hypothetical protein
LSFNKFKIKEEKIMAVSSTVLKEKSAEELKKVVPYVAKSVSSVPKVVGELIQASQKAGFDRRETLRYLVDLDCQTQVRYLKLLEAVEESQAEEVLHILKDESITYEDKLEMLTSVRQISSQNYEAVIAVNESNNRTKERRTLYRVGGAVVGSALLVGKSICEKRMSLNEKIISSSASVTRSEFWADAISKFSPTATVEVFADLVSKVIK